MKNILFIILSTIVIFFNSCSEKEEEIVYKVDYSLICGTYEGAYSSQIMDVQGNNQVTVDTINYQVEVNLFPGVNSNKSIIISAQLPTTDYLYNQTTLRNYKDLYYLDRDGSFSSFSFELSTQTLKFTLYQGGEFKKFEGQKL